MVWWRFAQRLSPLSAYPAPSTKSPPAPASSLQTQDPLQSGHRDDRAATPLGEHVAAFRTEPRSSLGQALDSQ